MKVYRFIVAYQLMEPTGGFFVPYAWFTHNEVLTFDRPLEELELDDIRKAVLLRCTTEEDGERVRPMEGFWTAGVSVLTTESIKVINIIPFGEHVQPSIIGQEMPGPPAA